MAKIDRNVFINKIGEDNKQLDQVPIILKYSVQCKQVEKIIQRHKNILKPDKSLQTILPNRPKYVYKNAPTLRDKIVKSIIEPPPNRKFTFFTGKCFYPCKKMLRLQTH